VAGGSPKQDQKPAVIIIVETDLPVLTVNMPQNIVTQKINKNDELQVDITYAGNPDDAFYSLIFFYNFDIVATHSYEYTSFAFRIWDHFNNFSDNN